MLSYPPSPCRKFQDALRLHHQPGLSGFSARNRAKLFGCDFTPEPESLIGNVRGMRAPWERCYHGVPYASAVILRARVEAQTDKGIGLPASYSTGVATEVEAEADIADKMEAIT